MEVEVKAGEANTFEVVIPVKPKNLKPAVDPFSDPE
jgi:hypothetical protein